MDTEPTLGRDVQYESRRFECFPFATGFRMANNEVYVVAGDDGLIRAPSSFLNSMLIVK